MATRTSTETKGPRKVVPQFFTTDHGVGLPRIDASPPFIYAHHRKRWIVLLGKIVPELSKFPLAPGVNRVRLSPDGRWDVADFRAMLERRHFKIIPHELAPDGETYMVEVDTMPEGAQHAVKATISCWDTAHPGEAHTEFDLAGYVAWLEGLVAKGYIDPITPHRAAEMLGTARSVLKDAEHKLAKGQARSSERVEALREQVTALEKAAKGVKASPVKGAKVKLDEAPPVKPDGEGAAGGAP